MRRCWFCVFETPSCIISLVPSIDVPAVCIRLHAPDEVFASSAGTAGLSLDLLRPSPVSCNTPPPPPKHSSNSPTEMNPGIPPGIGGEACISVVETLMAKPSDIGKLVDEAT